MSVGRSSWARSTSTSTLPGGRAGTDEAEVGNVLDRLGDPSEVSKAKSGALEIAAGILLPIGGLIPIGWFIGVILLWSSRVWTTGEKLAGTLLFPGGLLLPAGLTLGAVGGQSCSGVIQNADQLVTGAAQEVVMSCHGPTTLSPRLAA